MQVIAVDIIGTLEWYAPRQATSATVTIRDADSEVLAATAAVVDTVDTTLAEGAGEGQEYVRVASATGITPDRRYRIGGDQAEEVEVRFTDGTAIWLKNALTKPHEPSDTFEGTRLSYAYTPTVVGEHYLAIWNWIADGASQPPHPEPFHVAPRLLWSSVSEPDLTSKEPSLLYQLPDGMDLDDVITEAREELEDLVSSRGVQFFDYRSARQMRRAHIYHALMLCAETYGSSFQARVDYWRARRDENLQTFLRTTPAEGQIRDDVIEPAEEMGRTGDVEVDSRGNPGGGLL